MGNEASQEGGGPPGSPGSAAVSAPPGSEQLPKPSNGAPAGGAPAINSQAGKPPQPDVKAAPKPATQPPVGVPSPSKGPEPLDNRSLKVDPSVGGAVTSPTSPYSVPQIAPMPSSKLCPVCKTTDLSAAKDQASANTCTQCRSLVCSQCGFNPNPHLTEVQEWLCLNCQMQRALGMDMTTTHSKSPQQTPSPSHQAKPEPHTQPVKSSGPPKPDTQTQSKAQPPGHTLAKAPSQPDLSRSSPMHHPPQSRPDQARSAGSSPSKQPPEQPFGKLFGFGATLLNQASNLMTADPVAPSQPQPSPSKGPLGPAAGTPYKQTAPSQLAPKPKEPERTKCNCPLCKTELNVSNISEPPNYSICTQCHSQVCNMCGFNPTPHLVEKKEWLCLNCQTQRLMSGELGEQPFPASQPPLQKHPPTSQQQPSLQLKGVGQPPTSSLNLIGQPMKPVDAQESSRSPQSLSDTGYSSDGISSSQSEITGLIKEDETKLNKRGFGQSSHPSHSENTKTEISVPPLHCKALSDGQELPQDIVDGEDKRQRPHSLSISQDEKREEYKNILNRDVHEPQKEMADEDFMRRQILEMSADENEEYDEHGLQKNKKAHRHSINSGKDRQQVTHHSHRYVQGNEESSEVHISSREDDDMMSSQGGLRRFKTIELTTPNSDLNLDREPELEMESLTGSPDERSKGEYSSTIPATTPSYTSGTSPTSVSSMEEDSDSSPSRRQRLEEAKQQRKARHRSHGPLLPTIEDSSEEDELREEEELLKEQEKMREVEQHRIRSTARKAKRDKEELRAQRRRERSKTPPSNLSPIEDASPTEELRQAAEMEELHRSSCSEYSPSIDSEAEGFEMMTSKLYKSGSEYNLPSFMSLYSPTDKTSSTDKTTKKPEDAEIMKKAMLQNQQQATQREQVRRNQFEAHNNDHSSRTQPGEVKPPQSSMLSSHQQPKSLACSTQEKHIVDKGSRTHEHLDQANSPLTPGTSPTQLNAPGSFSMSGLPDVRVTQHFSKEGQPSSTNNITGSTPRAGLQNKGTSSRLSRQQSSQEPQPVVITQRPEPAHPTKPATVNSSTSPLASPTKLSRQKSIQGHTPTPSSQTPAHQKSAQHSSVDSVYNYQKTISGDTVHGSLPADKISLCRISTVPGTSRVVEQGQKQQTAAIVDLRTPFKSTPIIMTDQGMDLTSLASDARRYSVGPEIGSNRHSTIVQPLIMNLNATEQPHVTPTTASVTVAASMFTSNLKQPVIYGDPLQSRVDIGQCVGSAVCLTQNKITITDPSIPKIDACLEDLGIQQQQVQMQQLKLQQQQQKLEQELQQHHQQQASFARYNLPNKVNPVPKKDVMVTQTSTGQAIVSISSLPRAHLPLQVTPESISSPHSQDIFCGVPLELKNKPTAMNLTMEKTPVMMVQLDGRGLKETTVTHLVKEQNHLPQDVLDLTGQIKQETQAACCDVVYKIPFGGSCKGPFAQKSKVSDDMEPSRSCPASPAPHFSGSLSPKPVPDAYQCQEYAVGIQGMNPSHKPNPLTAPEKLQPSISDASLAVTAMPYYLTKHNPQVDVSPARHAYEGGSLGASMQYGSYTDLRQESISMNPHVPLRRYGSMSNINTDYRYSFRDLSNFQESNLAQYSATTAREIGRMCAALNSMEPNMGRYGNPELLPYGPVNGSLTRRVAGLQQGLHPVRANMMYGPDGRQSAQSQSYANLINARQAAIRALYPPAVRTADGMIFSTINTPIASTLPITTQPAPVLQPVQQGVYRPYQAGSMTAVPLSSLTRLPLAPPRMPLSTQSPYRYPTPTNFPVVCVNSGAPLTSTPQDTPVYLGKPLVTSIISSNTVTPVSTSVPDIHKTSIHTQSSDMMSANEQQPQASIPGAQPQPQIFNQPQMLTQTQAQALLKPPVQTHMLQTHHALQPPMQTQADVQGQHQLQTLTQLQTQPQTMLPNVPQATPVSAANACIQEKGKEEERLRQQEHLLQLERERVELEKLRQLRLHEELERDRLELQRRREKEQMLVQHEIQQLQSIKHQVLQQQQAERETQLVLQREQLAQQRMQLDQIQSLQQQLQQQLEEQKRQKTIAAEASATTTQGSIPGVSVVGGAVPPGFSIVCDQTGIVLQDFPPELQRTIGQNVQFWQPYGDGKLVQGVITPKSLPSSTSDMSLKNEEHLTVNAMKKLNSMPRLRDDIDAGDSQPTIKRIADSSVQTDEEDAEEKFMVSRRRRTRRIADCSVQTDDEDQAEWEQPVRRRRSRFSKHSEPSLEPKADISKVSSSSIAIQTTNDSACQTEPDQLERISPAIHINTLEPKTEFVHYISAPERTQKGESLACQTEPEVQSQGVVIPQLSVSTTISPYTPSVHLVGSGTTDPLSPRLQGPTRFERRKPDPLEMSYQNHLQNESLSTLTRQAPKSPQVLYSPVSPLSPHRMLENSLSSSERLNKAHVTPQKHFTTETPQRHQTLPRSIRNVQRSMSDPKPISPTADDLSKTKLSLCSHETLQNNQFATLPHTSSMRKVKRTLPSPPPEERTLPIVTPAISQMYSSPSTFQRVLPRPTQGPHNTGLLSELRAVEKESSKLRMQQAELEEEEKEIDAKLRYLELGITQRKENLIKERERRELAYIRGMGDARDYMSDSEVNNLGLGRTVYEGSGLLTRPSTAPLSHLSTDQLHSTQYPPTSSFGYQYAQAQPAASPQSLSAYQQIGFQPPQYPPISQSQALPGPFQSHSSPSSTLHAPGSRLFHNVPQSQSSLQTDLGVQQGHQGFHPSSSPVPYASQTLPFSGHTSHQTGQTLSLHAPAEVFTVHQKPRQTSLADLEQKLQTNYEVISSPLVATTTAQSGTYSATFTPTSMANTYGQYQPPEQTLSDRMEPVMDGQTSTYTSEGLYTNLEQNIPRNYVVIDDISELTKENIMPSHRQRTEMHSQYGGESGAPRGSSYNRTEDSKDLFDQSGNTNSTSGYQQHGYGSVTGGSSYYYDDYRRGGQKHQPKNVAPAMTSKRSKHRKQGMEISKFSPIEEARDVESDLASYGMPTSSSGSNTISYRSKKNVADQQQYYGISTRDDLEEEDQVYGSGRSRSTGYGIDKMTSRDSGSYRSKSYERDTVGPQRGEQSRSKHLVRPHNSEEESPLSPVGKPMGTGRSTMRVDSRNQYGSSHSLPDVQDHTKDRPRSHMKKSDDPYLVDDMHCAVSDSEAYHLGQEETDWFEKPRESRSDRSRRSGGGTHSSSHRRSHTKHTYNDYEEPTEEDHWSQEEYTHSRHYSSSSREQRHHGSNSGRHSSTRHTTEESRASRSSRAYPKDPSGRPEPRVSPSAQKKSHESRSSQGQHPSDYHHSSRSQKPGTSTSKRLDTQASLSPGASKPTTEQHHPTPGRPPTPQQQDERHMPDSQMTHPAETGPIPKDQPQVLKQTQAPVQHQTQSQTTSAQAQAPSQQLQSSFTPVPIQTKTEMMSDAPKQETKPAAPQPAKPVQATSTGIGSKAAQRPGGIGSATAGQPPAEGDSMFTKILPGGAAEQAGKLGDAVSAIGKKFTSFW